MTPEETQRMKKLRDITNEELAAELTSRIIIRCHCGKWGTYLGAYDLDGYTWRCHGCLRAITKCTCHTT